MPPGIERQRVRADKVAGFDRALMGYERPQDHAFWARDRTGTLFSDRDGNVLGYYRRYAFGTVTFAEGIGPVRCHERIVMAASGGLSGTMVVDLVAELASWQVAGDGGPGP
mgnify:CR=1 FL=1